MNVLLNMLCIVMTFLLASCSCEREKEMGISGKQEKPAVMVFNPKLFALVNVLDKEFFDMCHIKGSVNVTLDKIEDYALKNWNKDTTQIVVYCSNYMCTASFAAAKQLTDLGYKYVWAYEGGAAEALHLAPELGFEMQGTDCKASWLESYEKPEFEEEAEHKTGVKLISAQDLKKKVEEFAAKV